MNKVKNSRLVVQDPVLEDSYAAKTFIDRARQAGVKRDRLELAGTVAEADMPALYAQIDIGLAPFPTMAIENYFDMLWRGVPFISLATDLPASRLGLGLLSDIGLEALCAETQKAYVDKAAMLAGDIAALGSLRAGMRERLENSKVLNAPTAATSSEIDRCTLRTSEHRSCARTLSIDHVNSTYVVTGHLALATYVRTLRVTERALATLC